MKFLSFLNDETSIRDYNLINFKIDTRVLFERAVTQIPKEKAREIWNLYIQFEQNYGNQDTILKLQVLFYNTLWYN